MDLSLIENRNVNPNLNLIGNQNLNLNLNLNPESVFCSNEQQRTSSTCP